MVITKRQLFRINVIAIVDIISKHLVFRFCIFYRPDYVHNCNQHKVNIIVYNIARNNNLDSSTRLKKIHECAKVTKQQLYQQCI